MIVTAGSFRRYGVSTCSGKSARKVYAEGYRRDIGVKGYRDIGVRDIGVRGYRGI